MELGPHSDVCIPDATISAFVCGAVCFDSVLELEVNG